MRKIIIEVETDSDDSIGEIQRDVEMELGCCSTPFYLDTLEVYEQTDADTPQTERPCDNCQEWDCYGCDYKLTERSE